MRFELFIAARYLRAKRRQAVVGVITAISGDRGCGGRGCADHRAGDYEWDAARPAGPAAGIDLACRPDAHGGRWHAQVAAAGGTAAKLPHVTADAPGLYGQVLVSRGARSGGLMIKGVLPDEERRVTDLLDMVKIGSAEALEPALAGHPGRYCAAAADRHWADLATTLEAKVGDTVLVTSPQGELTPLGIVPKYPALLRGGHLPLRLLPVRLELSGSSGSRMRSICSASRT